MRVDRGRPGNPVALGIIDAQGPQLFEHRFVLDKLGDRGDAKDVTDLVDEGQIPMFACWMLKFSANSEPVTVTVPMGAKYAAANAAAEFPSERTLLTVTDAAPRIVGPPMYAVERFPSKVESVSVTAPVLSL